MLGSEPRAVGKLDEVLGKELCGPAGARMFPLAAT